MPAGKGKKGGKGKKAVAAATSPLANSVLRHLPPEVLGEIVFHLHGFQASDKFAGARAGRVFKVGDLGLGYYVDDRKSAVSDLHGFKASDKFAGARAGRVFKMGDLGLGYYVDDRKSASTALLALAATCTDMRAAVLPALLPLAKLKLRFARDAVLVAYSSSTLRSTPIPSADALRANAASGGPMGRQLRAEKFAKLCGLKEAARAVGDEAKFKNGDIVTIHGLTMGLTMFNGKRGIVRPGRIVFTEMGLCTVSLYEPVDYRSSIIVNEANLSK